MMNRLPRTDDAISDLVSDVRLTPGEHVEGYVFDPGRLDVRFVVEIYIGREPAGLMRAELYDDRLRKEGVGDGCYRFAFAIGHLSYRTASSLDVRLANSNRSLGAPIAIADSGKAGDAHGPGTVSWSGGLRFSGWLSEKPARPAPEVQAFVDGICVARATARDWTHLDDGAGVRAVRGFELHLPRELADGRVRRASFIDDLARPLGGGPIAFFAFEDGLAEFLGSKAEIASERIRGALYDRCFPQSLPFDLFGDWSRAFPLTARRDLAPSKLAIALVGDGDAEASIRSLQTQNGVDWVGGILSGIGGETSFRPDHLLEFLHNDAAECDVIVFALSGTLFRENALTRLAEGLQLHPRASAAYCDVTIATEDGREWPIAFPSFDYERMLEQGYCAYLFALPIATAREVAQGGASNLFRAFNMALDGRGPFSPPVHVPGFLARIPRIDLAIGAERIAEAAAEHLRGRGVNAIAEPARGALFPCAHIRRARAPAKVSLLIPTRDRVDLLRPCIESLRRTISFADCEAIVIDNESSDAETLDYLEEITAEGVRVLPLSGRFSFARLINGGAAHASGEFFLAMSNGVKAFSPRWLEEILSRAVEPDVGAVGATLLWPSGVVQHGGTVLGVDFAPCPAFGERIDGDPGYADQLVVAHECSAVDGACLLTPRDLFLEVGGFDDVNFPSEYYDVDYCLRLRGIGRRVVFTPRAKLLRMERFQPREQTQTDVARHELSRLRSRWGDVLLNDPCYSPLLSLNGAPYSGLAWPPRSIAPRLPTSVAPRPLPASL